MAMVNHKVSLRVKATGIRVRIKFMVLEKI